MGDFIVGLIKTVIAYFLLWCVVALIYFVITIMFSLQFNPNVVWVIVGIIFVLDLLITAGKKLDDM